MGTLGKGYTFGATESVTNAKLHTLVDSGSVSGIVNADIAVGAEVGESKISLDDSTGHTHSGSGDGTKVNLTAPNAIGGTTPAAGSFTTLKGTTIDGAIGSVTPSTIIATTIKANTSLQIGSGVVATDILDEDDMVSNSNVKLCTQQSIVAYTSTMSRRQVFTSSGTFTVPLGVTRVYISGCGAGGGGGGWNNPYGGGGGGGGQHCIRRCHTVTPEDELTVTINAGGAGGGAGANGSVGGTSVFDTITIAGGLGGARAFGAGGAGGAGGGGTYLEGISVGTPGGAGTAGGSGSSGEGGSTHYGNGGSPEAGAGTFGSGGAGRHSAGTAGAGGSGIIIVEW